jgi:multicomponent Na+:H+ antiporter subunit F
MVVDVVLTGLALFLLANVAVGVALTFRAGDHTSQLLSALLFGTAGVAALLLLSEPLGLPALRDVALVFVALAVLSVVVVVRVDAGPHGRSG